MLNSLVVKHIPLTSIKHQGSDWLPAQALIQVPVVQFIPIWLPAQAHMQASTVLKASPACIPQFSQILCIQLCILPPTPALHPKAQSSHSCRKPITDNTIQLPIQTNQTTTNCVALSRLRVCSITSNAMQY